MRKVLSYAALCKRLFPSSSYRSVMLRESWSSTRYKIDLSLLISNDVSASKIAFFFCLSVYLAAVIV